MLYIIKVFHKLLIIIFFFVYLLFVSFLFYLKLRGFFVIWTNTVRTEVVKTAKRAN